MCPSRLLGFPRWSGGSRVCAVAACCVEGSAIYIWLVTGAEVEARILNNGLAPLCYRMCRLSWADVVGGCLNVGGGVVDGDITASSSALAINFHPLPVNHGAPRLFLLLCPHCGGCLVGLAACSVFHNRVVFSLESKTLATSRRALSCLNAHGHRLPTRPPSPTQRRRKHRH
mgnify:CR=1 FL=1